ncbi:MAG: tRNA pseudouridine(38-40) synthase TruA [Thermodesulfobacteriota bacterium]|jgi:tRNA pseudouridine38-40 synthase|nr:tRNA pseudouridine(38-40) synthase TruA [Candidatus Dadabacteria bacterium]|tara:strand:- start:5688 stop:6422 length:735 start_codon:yes stop_codon:yes gene_type:complete
MKIRINIEYKGSKYYGWQKQSSGNTIQNELEMALKKITSEKINVIGSGRTDSGVHATNQVATFNLNKIINLKGLIIKLNKELPSDIRIKSYKQVSNNFHAQHSAINKTYIYKIKNKQIETVFEKGLVFYYKKPLDYKKMLKVSHCFIGEKNFKNYCKTGYSGESTIRFVQDIKIYKKGNYISIKITGTGFLRGMVRLLVGAMLSYSNGKISLKDVKDSLGSSLKKLPINYSVPAHGLFLTKVKY